MTRLLATWLLAGLLSTAVAAEPAAPFTMWVAEGRTNQVYLLGSVHLLRREDYPLPIVVDRAYADAEFLVMELDIDDLADGVGDPTEEVVCLCENRRVRHPEHGRAHLSDDVLQVRPDDFDRDRARAAICYFFNC